MALGSRFTLNHAGVQSYLDGDHGVEALLDRAAQGVLSAAQADPHDDTGTYERSLHIETDHTDRMAKRVVADVPYAMVQEARYGVLARALDGAK